MNNIKDMKISDTDLSTRIKNSLKAAEIHTVGHLCLHSEESLPHAAPGIGKLSMMDLKLFLAKNRLILRNEKELKFLYFILESESPIEVIDTEGKKYKITVEEA